MKRASPINKTHPANKKDVKIPRYQDVKLQWVHDNYPQLEPWRELALLWLESLERVGSTHLTSLSTFLKLFLIEGGLPLEPRALLSACNSIPVFEQTTYRDTLRGRLCNNLIYNFIDFVLRTKFSHLTETGRVKIDPAYHNPIQYRSYRTGESISKKVVNIPRHLDVRLQWITDQYPQLEPWRELALLWLGTLARHGAHHFESLSAFLEQFLVGEGLPLEPEVLLSVRTSVPDFTKSIHGDIQPNRQNNHIHQFLNFVLRTKFSHLTKTGLIEIDPAYHNPIQYRNWKTGEVATTRNLGVRRDGDVNLGWVKQTYPQLEPWRILAVEWLKGKTSSLSGCLRALVCFLERYLVEQTLPLDPKEFFSYTTLLPDFYITVCPQSRAGIKYNNNIHDFLDFVLREHFFVKDDFGRPVVSAHFRNPVAIHSSRGLPRLDESVYSPLPYGYLDKLVQILAPGSNFSDWTFCQNVMGTELGLPGVSANDWFPVTEEELDRDDPDCIVRVRGRTSRAGGPVLEMWSPVRWVALLVKLLVPLRTFQVRMLDSGEADTWRYEGGEWVINSSRLAIGHPGRPNQQGVLRRWTSPAGSTNTLLYINTNKTADIAKSGHDKGFTVPWPETTEPIYRNVYYWLEKLRNWQEKYNPISRRTPWAELDSRHISAKSDVQLASYLDTCFLFRMREAKKVDRHLPIREFLLETNWHALLLRLEHQLEDQGETHADGSPITLVYPSDRKKGNLRTYFPLHSLRVSMVTALALEGQVPFPILAKAVGHSRLLMTLYYTKPGATHFSQALAAGAARLEANKEKSTIDFLRNTEHARMVKTAIANSTASIAAAIPVNRMDRNPAGWLDMGIGVCLVGGNISELEGNKKIGGCHNGGPSINGETDGHCGMVHGGPRNCVRCRWFMTMPHYMPALAAKFNNLSYGVDEAMADATRCEEAYYKLKEDQTDAIQAGHPFARMNDLLQAERLRESALGRWSNLAETLVACWRLIDRCMEVLKNPGDGDGMKLISVGKATDVTAKFEETPSELLQLSGVCEGLELYPDLEPGKAILRRSQLLDAAFANEGQPPMLMRFSEQEQLLVGNAVMRHLAHSMNPKQPEVGKRQVIAMMEAGELLGERLGVNFAEILADAPSQLRMNQPVANGSNDVL